MSEDTRRAEKPHEHFCSSCFVCGSGRRKSRGGWWRCFDAKCTRLPSHDCRAHRALKQLRGASNV
jgi:hypothetical protein